MRYAICYVSTAAEGLTTDELHKLLNDSEAKNNSRDMKGVLLYSEGNFFQVLEGEKEQVIELFNQINSDPRHNNVIQIVGRDLEHKAFDGFKSDIITNRNKYKPDLLEEYLLHVDGIDPPTKKVVKEVLEVFIETRR